MKRIVQIISFLLVLGSMAVWLATGANRGWTKTSVPLKTTDEVTGIEGITYQKQFVPGLDFLGSALMVSAVLAGVSLFFRNNPKTKIKP